MARIMIVEDEPISGLQLQESIERMGHKVADLVASADEVIASAMKHRPDLVLMDINLRSFIDGVDAAGRLRLLSDVPVIYLTAYPSQGSEDRALKTKPVAYLLKPVSEKLLAEAIEKAIRLPRGQSTSCL